MRFLLLLLLTLAACAAPAPEAPAPSPEQQRGKTPELTVRNAHGLAYDAAQKQVLLFGGADELQVHGDLWAWGGDRWQRLASDGPPPRTFPSLAFDRQRNRLVLFGGNRVLFGTEDDGFTFLGDTWEWDGKAWHHRSVPGPPARAEAAMAYDEARGQIVLFGGYMNRSDERTRFGDTWTWDGERWQLASEAGPSPRNGAALADDAHRQRLVLFGGSGGAADTWEWDGTAWTEVTTAESPPRFNAALAYDARHGQVLRFGGWDGDGRTGDTWTFDGQQWQELAVDGPAPRNHAPLAYDETRGLALLFGGHDGPRVLGDTWLWDGSTWTQAHSTPPRPRLDNGH